MKRGSNLTGYCRISPATEQQPYAIHLFLDFPRSGIGKIQRQKVTQWVAGLTAKQSAATAGANSVPDPLSAMIVAITRSRAVKFGDDARLDRDLNLDSLARVQLQTELEQRLGVSIGDEEFARIATLGELRARLGLTALATREATVQDAPSPVPLAAGAPRHEPEFYYPRWTWWPTVQAARVVFQEAIMRPLVWLLAAPTVSRSDAFRPPSQPALLIANHVTAYDGPLVLYALPAAMRRRVAIAMSGEMLEDMRHARNQGNWLLNLLGPLEYWLITVLFHVFPLPRTAGFRRSFAHAGEAMDRGYHVLVFPEGHRSADGALQRFRPGIGLLARDSSATVLPVALKGLGELKLRKRSWFRSGSLHIRVGEAIPPDAHLAPEELAEALHTALARLMQE